jgi:hypothetical protein
MHDNRYIAEQVCRGSSRSNAVLLAEKDFEPWLSGESGVELARPATRRYVATVADVETCQQFEGAC